MNNKVKIILRTLFLSTFICAMAIIIKPKTTWAVDLWAGTEDELETAINTTANSQTKTTRCDIYIYKNISLSRIPNGSLNQATVAFHGVDAKNSKTATVRTLTMDITRYHTRDTTSAGVISAESANLIIENININSGCVSNTGYGANLCASSGKNITISGTCKFFNFVQSGIQISGTSSARSTLTISAGASVTIDGGRNGLDTDGKTKLTGYTHNGIGTGGINDAYESIVVNGTLKINRCYTNGIYVSKSGIFKIGTNGKVTLLNNYNGIGNNGTATIISGTTIYSNTNNGINNSGTFTMSGGSVYNNGLIANNTKSNVNNGVSNTGTFTMSTGTTIYNNQNNGIYNSSAGKVTMTGGKTTYNKKGIYNEGTFNMSGGWVGAYINKDDTSYGNLENGI